MRCDEPFRRDYLHIETFATVIAHTQRDDQLRSSIAADLATTGVFRAKGADKCHMLTKQKPSAVRASARLGWQ